MKRIIFALHFLTTSFLLQAQPLVEKINLKGSVYSVTKTAPSEYDILFGRYDYERGENGNEPIIKLEKNGTGIFQPHMAAEIPITFWFDCDENGVVRKQIGGNGRYQVTLLIQYGESSNGNYATGQYDLMGVIVVPDQNYAVIYGERYKKLK